MIKFLKKLWNKCFGKKEVEVIQPIPQPKPQHCALHKRYMKSCLACQEAIK
jgi:hypothetical protein